MGCDDDILMQGAVGHPHIPPCAAERKNTGKPKLSMLMRGAAEGISRVAEFGANKYSRDNYRKGFPDSSIFDSMMRHILAYTNGEEFDPESGLCHLDHIAWNAGALLEQRRVREAGGQCGIEDIIAPLRDIRVLQGLEKL